MFPKARVAEGERDRMEERRTAADCACEDGETARKDAARLFAQPIRFVRGVASREQLPEAVLPEVAFAGRSNVGKSSLLNALVGRRALARTSKTPGRTRELNFFELGQRLTLVDLPGYGYAAAPRKKVAAWTELVRDYLRGRPNLMRVCLLVDARHGIRPSDVEIMDLLAAAAVPFRVVLTKFDLVRGSTREARIAETEEAVHRRKAAMPGVLATSSRLGYGIDQLRLDLAGIVDADGQGERR